MNDVIISYIKHSLSNVLRLIQLEQEGHVIPITGFQIFSNQDSIAIENDRNVQPSKNLESKYNYESIFSVKRTEPRIELIAKLLQGLLQVITLKKDSTTVRIDGFRLKKLHDWLVPHVGMADLILNQLAYKCDGNCRICHWKMNPPRYMKMQRKHISYDELKTRLAYFSESTALFDQGYNEICEVLTHPHALDLLKQLRKKSNSSFFLLTTGTPLSEEIIQELVELKPIIVPVYLHSANREIRRMVMRNKNPEIAIQSIPLLKKYQIPYIVAIEMQPTIPFDDLRQTIRYADENDAYCVRIFLPGFTKYTPKEHQIDMAFWKDVVDHVRIFRTDVETPVLIDPHLYEENLYEIHDVLNCRIHGIIKHSPAYRADLKVGDVIVAIDNEKIMDREHASDLLYSKDVNTEKSLMCTIRRGEDIFNVELQNTLNDNCYPDVRSPYNPFGLFIARGVGHKHIESLWAIIDKYQAQHVLFLTSELVKPAYQQLLNKSSRLAAKQIHLDIEIPPNEFFGGNICMGDLMVVRDFTTYIARWKNAHHQKPDVVVIPSSPFYFSSGWKRDLIGDVFLEIERKTKIPVELLGCEPIW